MQPWQPHAQTTAYIVEQLQRLQAANPFVLTLAQRLHTETGTRLFDWVERLSLRDTSSLNELGYRSDPNEPGTHRHPEAMLPAIQQADDVERAVLRVESVRDFLSANDMRVSIDGVADSPIRKARIAVDGNVECWAIEQHGSTAWEFVGDPPSPEALHHHAEQFRLRERRFPTSEEGFAHAEKLIQNAIAEVGVNAACDLFFQAERAFWQRRNHAAQVQRRRQDALGLGWANHDHHTYRSSRGSFCVLIRLLERLGFACRERFSPGAKAGWGAQVLEQSACRVVIFADVDLSADEVVGDFAHEPLAERNTLGTVGLWCELHGEAFLEAGMHHLEAQFDFAAARKQLAELGVESMAPFTDMPHLKQAFTKGERWPVDPNRIRHAIERGFITVEQAETFASQGAIGSHLEILQRDAGYKGFNQVGITEIIHDTDPRHVRS